MSPDQRSGGKKRRPYHGSLLNFQFYKTVLSQGSCIMWDAVDIKEDGNGWNYKVMWSDQTAVLIAVCDKWEEVGRQ